MAWLGCRACQEGAYTWVPACAGPIRPFPVAFVSTPLMQEFCRRLGVLAHTFALPKGWPPSCARE